MYGNLSATTSQAYLNEYKGNLFEYLVANELAKRFQLQSQFTQSLGENQWSLLRHYEREVRKLAPELVEELPSMAKETAAAYLSSPPLANASAITRICLQGKTLAKGSESRSHEGDLTVVIDGREQLVSLKLGKVGSFVNTKSAGIKSFIAEYFSSFADESEWEQKNLNRHLEDSHSRMEEELYQQKQFPFRGKWDDRWREAGMSELPGELPNEFKMIVYRHYGRVMARLRETLRSFYQRDEHRFKICLLPLLGFTRELTQVKVYHRSHRLHSIDILEQDSILQLLKSLKWSFESEDKGFFHIHFHRHQFQLRLKPMNKFTALALKVNCAVKTLASAED